MSAEWSSPQLRQRSRYEPKGPIERWMVPVLGAAIDAALAKYAKPTETARRCLDVGCGSQPFRNQLEALGFQYTGFDANQNFESTVEVIGTIDASLPPSLERGTFQFILCTEVLEHVPRWQEAFRNLADLLAPGGRLLVTTPHIWIPHEEPADFFRPTSLGIEYHGRAAGLMPIEVVRLGDGQDVLGTLLSAVKVKPAGGHWWNRPVSVVPKILIAALLGLIKRSGLRERVAFRTSFYLSTLAVFEKPSAAESLTSEH